MNLDSLINSHWYSDLQQDIQQAIQEIFDNEISQSDSLLRELDQISSQRKGWNLSLSDPNLPQSVRNEIHTVYQQAEQREQEINLQLERHQKREAYAEQVLSPELVLDSLNRLDDVLAGDNATRSNLELSLHIDRIDCFSDGHVKMKMCKLGAFPECLEFLKYSNPEVEKNLENSDSLDGQSKKAVPRRRAKLRVDSIGPESQDLDAAVTFAADPHRFSGLSEEWFEVFEFDAPCKMPWYQRHAAEVFQRRQEANLTFRQLVEEFSVSKPTISKAIKFYLEQNPDAEDTVSKIAGSKRTPKFDVERFGHEARGLWEAGMSKLKLADKYGCSSPTIDKALAWSYQQDGRSLPTKAEREHASSQKARLLHDQGMSLEQISLQMNISDVTARRYLRMSFEQEGNSKPDLRHVKKPTE
jgi:lambda repressor-like predicted transcriptional regulator